MNLTKQKGVDRLRRFLIPLSMVAGSILGIIFGRLFDISIDISVFVGAILGIIAGSIAQSIINEITPDEYFKSISKVEKIKSNAIEVENLDDDIPVSTTNSRSASDTKVISTIDHPMPSGTYRETRDLMDDRRADRKIPLPKEPIKKPKRIIVEEEDD